MNNPKFIMMVGLPASGKSSIAKELSNEYNAKIFSSDELRREMFGNENHQEDNDRLFRELHKRIKTDLSNGLSVIYDACNINYKRRKVFMQEINKYNPHKICAVVAKSYENCLMDNIGRERGVPDYVIKRMLMNFWVPQYYEGWDEIKIEYCGEISDEYETKLLKSTKGFDQENEHHTLTLDEHLNKTQDYLLDRGIPSNHTLAYAAVFHDVGKMFTKTFDKKDGTTDGNAHYYNHHNVSAYEAMIALYYRVEDGEGLLKLLDVCNLVQWHMRTYDIEKNGGKEKFIRLVGEEFYDELMALHEADKAAH